MSELNQFHRNQIGDLNLSREMSLRLLSHWDGPNVLNAKVKDKDLTPQPLQV